MGLFDELNMGMQFQMQQSQFAGLLGGVGSQLGNQFGCAGQQQFTQSATGFNPQICGTIKPAKDRIPLTVKVQLQADVDAWLEDVKC